MATDSNVALESFPASADLSASQDCFVKVDSNGRVELNSDGGLAIGVLGNKPTLLDQAASVMTAHGRKVTVKAGDVITKGQSLASDSSGRAIPVATSGDYILGIALEAAAAANERITMLFAPNGQY